MRELEDFTIREDDIAVVGLAGRLPGARDLHEFWRNLCDGVEAIRFFSDDELLHFGANPETLKQPNCVKAKGIIEDIDMFDASFFGFTPREAEIIDPQQRIFFECSWEALENAGYDPKAYPGKSACSPAPVQQLLVGHFRKPGIVRGRGRIKQPSATTRISSQRKSLTSLSVAQASTFRPRVRRRWWPCILHVRRCSTASATWRWLAASRSGCREKSAYLLSGRRNYVARWTLPRVRRKRAGNSQRQRRGIVVLKRLDDALCDGDNIRAVIKGSAVNNDGATKVGYTAPSVEGQVQVINEALVVSGVIPKRSAISRRTERERRLAIRLKSQH